MTRRIKAIAAAALVALSSCYHPKETHVVDRGIPPIEVPGGARYRVYKVTVSDKGFAKELWFVLPDSAGLPAATVTGGKRPTTAITP